MTKVRNPMGVFSKRQLQLLAHMLKQSGEEVNVLRENAGILHSEDSCALQGIVLNVQVKFSTALGLALIRPIHSLAAFRGKWNGDDGSFGPWLRFEARNDIGNLLLHAIAIVSLITSPLGHEPLVILFLAVLPAHVFLGVKVDAPKGNSSVSTTELLTEMSSMTPTKFRT
eukprot:CAMPEP_0114694386 /NCGR_PEP_ID=MMETSP0191-20121206/70114_1 /TAXON_ID=126664 /ORGANISM="Sorites sp." /LENGTH=169 /DNA_ID=CAMNT_0001989193 /DNA_START=125 /DNA_END=631 /DNA_ORIENTATION=+